MKRKKSTTRILFSHAIHIIERLFYWWSQLFLFFFFFFLKNDRYAFGHIINRSMNNKIEIQEYSCIRDACMRRKERKKERVKVTFDHLQASTNVRSYIHFSFLSSTFFLLFFSRIKKNKPNAKNFLSVLCHSERRVVLTDYYYLQLTIKKGTSNWTHYTQRKDQTILEIHQCHSEVI